MHSAKAYSAAIAARCARSREHRRTYVYVRFFPGDSTEANQ
jgi:hypothetical protein